MLLEEKIFGRGIIDMVDVEDVLRNLVECNTIKDKENKKILDYIERMLVSLRI